MDSLYIEPSSKILASESSLAETFVSGFLEGAIYKPAKAIEQLSGKQDDQSVSLHEAEADHLKQGAKQGGEIVGSLIPFFALSALTKGTCNQVLGKALTPSFSRNLLEQASTGFLLGSVLTPSKVEAGESLFSSRTKQGLSSACTFGSMTLSAHLLEKASLKTMPSLVSEHPYLSRSSIAALSGASGGVVDIELKSGFKARPEELLASAAGYALFGGIMEGCSIGLSRARSISRSSRELPALNAGIENAGIENSGIENSGFENSGFENSGFENSGFENSGFENSGFERVGTEKYAFANARTKSMPPREKSRPGESTQVESIGQEGKLKQSAGDSSSDNFKTRDQTKASDQADTRDYLTPANQDLHLSREEMLGQFKETDCSVPSSHSFSLYSAIVQMRFLTDAQKQRVCDLLTCIHNYYSQASFKNCELAAQANKSWASCQAAVADVFHERIAAAKTGSHPDKNDFENQIFLAIFSQFRKPGSNAKLGQETLSKNSIEAAQKILTHLNYPKNKTKELITLLADTAFEAQDLSRISFANRSPFSSGVNRQRAAAELSQKQGSECKASNKIDYDYEKELDELIADLSRSFSDWNRYDRFFGVLEEFEKQAAKRSISVTEQAEFYAQLRRLLNDKSKSELNHRERMNLAEQVLNHATYPERIDQGANNTCNVTTVEKRLYARKPQLIAQMIADLADNAMYLSKKNRLLVDLSASPSGLKADLEARQNLYLQENSNSINEDGSRDWASQLAQTVLAKIHHKLTNELIYKNKIVSQDSLAYDRAYELKGFLNEAARLPLVDKNGKTLSRVNPKTELFCKDGPYIQEVDRSQLLYNEYGECLPFIARKNAIETVHDCFGNKVDSIDRGIRYFDKNGNFMLYESRKGEIEYDKLHPDLSNLSGTGERLYLNQLKQKILLKGKMEDSGDFELIDNPFIETSKLQNIAQEISGLVEDHFVLIREETSSRSRSYLGVTSLTDFEAALLRLNEQKNFPAICLVHTGQSKPGPLSLISKSNPFSSATASGAGGWHVVNLEGFDPLKKLLKVSNQWGSRYNHLDPGLPLATVFRFMQKEPQK